jgi:hypothetical protein
MKLDSKIKYDREQGNHPAHVAIATDAIAVPNWLQTILVNFVDWEKSGEYMRTSPRFAAHPMGTFVDADKMITTRHGGTSSARLRGRVSPVESCISKITDVMASIGKCFARRTT